MKKTKFWRWFNILLPMFVGLLVISLPFQWGMDGISQGLRSNVLRSLVITNLILLVIFYLHTYLIFPLRETENGIIKYVVFLFLTTIAFVFANRFLLPVIPRISRSDFIPPGFYPDSKDQTTMVPSPYISLLPFSVMIITSFGYGLYKEKVKREKEIKERENIHLKTELDFLRSQISPHFMFNLLNTLVSMARKRSELLEPSLISLSQLMRYMLYDRDGSSISLEQEIEYLKSYINLQLLRFGEDIGVNLYLSGDFEPYRIEPMLLIPFVENAFKHGMELIENPTIDISVVVAQTKTLQMMVVNGIAANEKPAGGSSGIGLTNVKRRLQLLYPAKHTLDIKQDMNTFTIILEIKL